MLVSNDETFCNLAVKWVPHINEDALIVAAGSIEEAAVEVKGGSCTVVAVDHSSDISIFDMAHTMDRLGVKMPLIMLSKGDSSEDLADVINLHIDAHVLRGKRDPMDFFTDFVQKAVLASERYRAESERRINESRMKSLIAMAKMGDRDFSDVVNYALDESLKLTESQIGYVATYDKTSHRLKMLSWSKSAMRTCSMGKYPVEFDLDNTGIWGEPVRRAKTVVVNDYESDTKVIKKGTPMGHVSLKRLLMVPIIYQGQVIGTAGVGNKESEYTWFDEVQLTLIMEELFSIYSRIGIARGYTLQSRLVRQMLEKGRLGLAFISVDMNVIMMNEVAARVLGAEPVLSNYVPLSEMNTPGTVLMSEAIRWVRINGEDRHVQLVSDGRTYDMAISVQNDISFSGFSVMISDVTELTIRDDKIARALKHIDVLEGPVLTALSRLCCGVTGTHPFSQSPMMRRVTEITAFMDEFHNVGISNAQWMNLEKVFDNVAGSFCKSNVEFKTSVHGLNVLADPGFAYVFKHLIENSIQHGSANIITVKFTISGGELCLIYSDNGSGLPEDPSSVFDMVDKGKFGMLMVTEVLKASDMSIEAISSPDGAVFEITVPPSGYSINL